MPTDKGAAVCRAPRHGTRAAYVAAGCRCPEARAANTAYRTWHNRRTAHVAAGAVPPLTVPVEQTRSVLEQLLGTGWSRRRIEAASGVKRERLSRISGGTCHPVSRVRWATHAALLALLEQDTVVAEGARVDAYATWQRIHGLIALGYPKTWIAGQLNGGRALQLHEFTITARNAEKVRALADHYGATPGPSDRARAYAADRGWTPDLIWQADDDALDIPTGNNSQIHTRHSGRPPLAIVADDVDPVVVERLVHADAAGTPANTSEKYAAYALLRKRGTSPSRAAEVLRLSLPARTLFAHSYEQDDERRATA